LNGGTNITLPLLALSLSLSLRHHLFSEERVFLHSSGPDRRRSYARKTQNFPHTKELGATVCRTRFTRPNSTEVLVIFFYFGKLRGAKCTAKCENENMFKYALSLSEFLRVQYSRVSGCRLEVFLSFRLSEGQTAASPAGGSGCRHSSVLTKRKPFFNASVHKKSLFPFKRVSNAEKLTVIHEHVSPQCSSHLRQCAQMGAPLSGSNGYS
jgi:hypothetical protein